jgi:hypothetical protein
MSAGRRGLLLLALATTLGAARPFPRAAHPDRSVQEGQILAQFFQIRTGRIQQSLGLSEDRSRALAERWGRWDRVVMERGGQMAGLRLRFNQILLGPGPEEDKCLRVKPLLDQFLLLRQHQEEDRRRFEEAILAGLSPAQQARMIVLMEDIQTRLREALRDARAHGPRP